MASPLHGLPPGLKLAALALAGAGLFFLRDPVALAAALAGVAGLYGLARLPPRAMLAELRPALPFVAILALVQALTDGPEGALVMVLRVSTLVLLAALVTLTTRTSAMMEAVERALRPLARFGVDPEKVGLALSLAIRFVPVVAHEARFVREAQAARGRGRNPLALAVPLVVRVLKVAGEVADAIEARSPPAGGSSPATAGERGHAQHGGGGGLARPLETWRAAAGDPRASPGPPPPPASPVPLPRCTGEDQHPG